jgi:hypothetical protein
MAVTPDASYRFQYDSANSQIFVSYLPEGETLITTPQSEEAMQEDDEQHPAAAEKEDETMQDVAETGYPHDDGDDSNVKRTDSGEQGSNNNVASGPPSKRVKLK